MLQKFNVLLWGGPVLLLMLGTGLVISVRTRFVQFRLLIPALKLMIRQWKNPSGNGGNPAFRALCTALAATVGTGNIAGVAGAIAIGGPGAVFWMWVSGFVGMATKFAEAGLAVRFSGKNARGEAIGGPMYIMEKGLGPAWRPVAISYCVLALIACLGVGNATQIDAVLSAGADAARSFGLRWDGRMQLLLGTGIALLVWQMVRGGAGGIGEVAEFLVPFASAVYLLLGMGVLVRNFDRLDQALVEILRGAFSPEGVTGGAVGSGWIALRIGVSRGVFTNEAGMGTAAMAHGGARGVTPVEQGMLGIVEVFVDTILICTMTALVILVSGVEISYGQIAGADLTARAFAACYGDWVRGLLSLCLGCFALATIVGWGLYAGRCLEYLTGKINWKWLAVLQALGVLAGSIARSGWIWDFSEIANAVMAIPNLIALLCLSGTAANLGLDSRGKICYDVPAA